MKIKLFTVSILDSVKAEEELNRFLAAHQIISVEKDFVQFEQNAYWCFVLTYGGDHQQGSAKKPAVDYREVLNEKDFSAFAQLRELRNRLAKQEGKPAYAIFTNEQLAALVTQSVTSKEDMAKIPGIGESRVTHYADQFLALMTQLKSGDGQ